MSENVKVFKIKKHHKMKAKKTAGDYAIIILMVIIMTAVFISTLYPFLNALAISLNFADDTVLGGITIFPRKFTIDNYRNIFGKETIWWAYFITFIRTIIGTVGGLLVTGAMSFALSRKTLVGRRIYTIICLIPMYFGGGLIPTYFPLKPWVLPIHFGCISSPTL